MQVNNLQTKYKDFRNWFITAFLLKFSLIVILYRYIISIALNRSNYFRSEVGTEFFIIGVFFIYVILFYTRRTLLTKKLKAFKDLCKDTFKKCDKIVDYTDWSNFRKRPLYDNKRLRAQDIVDKVYQVRNYRLFPYRTEYSCYGTLSILDRLFEASISLGLILIMGYSFIFHIGGEV